MPNTPTGGAQRILVVDDNRDAADTLAILLRLAGHHVQTAYDGAAALAVAKQQRPDVVLLDLAMPKLSGYKVIENLRGQPETADALFIAVTGYGQAVDRIHTSDAGFHLHLVKPVDARQLVAYLNGEPNRLVPQPICLDWFSGMV